MVKVAWKNLMDYYNQVRRRRERAIAAGTRLRRLRWPFYYLMSFLRQDKNPTGEVSRVKPAEVSANHTKKFIVQNSLCHHVIYYSINRSSVLPRIHWSLVIGHQLFF